MMGRGSLKAGSILRDYAESGNSKSFLNYRSVVEAYLVRILRDFDINLVDLDGVRDRVRCRVKRDRDWIYEDYWLNDSVLLLRAKRDEKCDMWVINPMVRVR